MSSKKATGTWRVKPNDNKSVAIGNVLLSEAFFKKYRLDREISSLKSKGVDLAKLAELLVAYKLGDNFSILRAHEFVMEPAIRDRFGLQEFSAKTLYRAVERLGQNRERIVSVFRRRILVSLTGAELQGRTKILAPFRCDLGFNIKLGKDVLINYNCTFLNTAEISVGDNAMIGPDCHQVTAVHPIDPVERRDWRFRGSPIRIGRGVWLCANVTVVPGVTIGDGSVVGAGNPARIIRRIGES